MEFCSKQHTAHPRSDRNISHQVVVFEHDSGFIGAWGITPPKGFAGDGSCNEKEQTPLKKLKCNHANKLKVIFFSLLCTVCRSTHSMAMPANGVVGLNIGCTDFAA